MLKPTCPVPPLHLLCLTLLLEWIFSSVISWHSVPCNHQCLHLSSCKYRASLLSLTLVHTHGTSHQPWDKGPVTISSSDVGRTLPEWTQWWWLLGRGVFSAMGPLAGSQRDKTCMSISLCISKENHEIQSWKSLLQIVKATICLFCFHCPCSSFFHASKMWAPELDFINRAARKICVVFTKYNPSRNFNVVRTGWKGKIQTRIL